MSLFKPWTWVTHARWGRFLHGLYWAQSPRIWPSAAGLPRAWRAS